MKITKQYLKQVIKEELEKTFAEGTGVKAGAMGGLEAATTGDEQAIQKLLSEPPSQENLNLFKNKLASNPKFLQLVGNNFDKLNDKYKSMMASGGLGPQAQQMYKRQMAHKQMTSSPLTKQTIKKLGL